MLYALSLRSSLIGPIRAAARYVQHLTRHACGKALLLTCWVARSEIVQTRQHRSYGNLRSVCRPLDVKERRITLDEDISFANIRQNIGASAQGCSLNRISGADSAHKDGMEQQEMKDRSYAVYKTI